MKSRFSLAALVLALSCTTNSAPAQAPPKKKVIDPDAFIGMLEDLRRSDVVVKMKVDKVTPTGDLEKEVLGQRFAIMDGKVLTVFKGKADVTKPMQIEVDLLALVRRSRAEGHYGRPWYVHWLPRPEGETYVFLISKSNETFKARSVLMDARLVGEYVKASRLADEDAALALVKILCAEAYDGKRESEHLLLALYDLKLNYEHLKTTGDGFRRLYAERHKDVLRGLAQHRSFGFSLAVWLAAHADEPQRREALATLLERHDENEKEIADMKAKRERDFKEAFPNGIGGLGGLYIDPLHRAESWSYFLICAMDMIQNPAWTREILTVREGDIFHHREYFDRKVEPAEVLKKVKAMVR